MKPREHNIYYTIHFRARTIPTFPFFHITMGRGCAHACSTPAPSFLRYPPWWLLACRGWCSSVPPASKAKPASGFTISPGQGPEAGSGGGRQQATRQSKQEGVSLYTHLPNFVRLIVVRASPIVPQSHSILTPINLSCWERGVSFFLFQ